MLEEGYYWVAEDLKCSTPFIVQYLDGEFHDHEGSTLNMDYYEVVGNRIKEPTNG